MTKGCAVHIGRADSAVAIQLPPLTPKKLDLPPPRRQKLWELPPELHCSVIGTCLTMEELRKVCRQMGDTAAPGMSDYQLHGRFVQLAQQACPETRLVQKTLERKFDTIIKRFSAARHEKDIDTLWNEALTQGEIAGAYWALMTHPALSQSLFKRSFGEVHMLSHLVGASHRAQLRQAQTLAREHGALKNTLTEQQGVLQQLRQQHERDQAALREREALLQQRDQHLREAEQRLATLESGVELRRLSALITDLERRLQTAERRAEQCFSEELQTLREHNQVLLAQLHDTQRECSLLEVQLARRLTPVGSDESPSAPQLDLDLSGRRVLYVGGALRLKSHFRTLVEQHDGQFLHHDGGVEDSHGRLHGLLHQADIAICPLDCVSHRAVEQLKRFCQQHGKPLLLLRSSSLSAFNRALFDVAA